MPSSPNSSSNTNGNNANGNGNAAAVEKHAWSKARRTALNEECQPPTVNNFFPIARYFDAAERVYEAFQQTYQEKQLDDAYVYGKRYCQFCLDAIPQHNYYDSPSRDVARLKAKHARQVEQVIDQLDQVATWMDREEFEKVQKQERERSERERRELQELQARFLKTQHQQHQTSTKGVGGTDVQASALSKLEKLARPSQQQQQQPQELPRDPSGEQQSVGGSSRYRVMSDSSDDGDEGTSGGRKQQQHGKNGILAAIPPPVVPPSSASNNNNSNGVGLPPPPSYHQIQSHRNFLGPAQPSVSLQRTTNIEPPSSYQQQQQQQQQAKPQRKVPMRQLQAKYRQEYMEYQQSGKIRVRALPTYQGRVDSSTNGCTVISALVAARHLGTNGTIDDDTVAKVIDYECGPILRQIRSKLGLGGHALIIPSDVHDHLVDHKIMKQEFFEGAAGGNIMDPIHVGEFLKLLAVGEDKKGLDKKAAATLFFREHVISIVKTKDTRQYDLIDSLPSANGNNGGLGSVAATRTTCADIYALRVLLNWYASRKFTDSNCGYIDRNDWEDNLADFDPRVFQGFVWMIK